MSAGVRTLLTPELAPALSELFPLELTPALSELLPLELTPDSNALLRPDWRSEFTTLETVLFVPSLVDMANALLMRRSTPRVLRRPESPLRRAAISLVLSSKPRSAPVGSVESWRRNAPSLM